MDEEQLIDVIYKAVSAKVIADAAPLIEAFGRAAEGAKQAFEQKTAEISELLQQVRQTQAGWHEIIASIQERNSELVDELGRLGARVAALEERAS